ncbi:choline dehydrogenase [Exophiala viscosa]|uniref:Choline dehydrogenase n=1 Tax=Exophiala viscosa TaxID=2486360 RepID=A0AAN6E6Y0_9EURO|nr:choline dehydrogenase [Exophiala viscosa]KAI1627073.1 choline dehydrogenase [Exophiala viscosa]
MSPGRQTGQEEYDFIVCGGGTSGCVVAGRLAEDTNARILLVEAGPHNKDLENVHMTGGWSNNFDSETDWNLVTSPMQGVDGRQVKLSRGKFLGGSSGVNGTLCIRGSKQDYDDWKLPGWSGDEMFRYMSKSETFHNKPWFQADEKAHGYNGPLHTEPHDLAPISKLVLESFESSGMPLVHDMFTNGETAHGCGHAPRTVHKGIRTTGADFVTNDQHKHNIDIVVETLVDKINFEKQNGQLEATSVTLVDKTGATRDVKVRKEVIVSGGTYCSPAILLRSGIGPKDDLEKLGIKCLVDSPGVGKNLLDHLIVFVFYEVAKDGLTNDHLAYHGDAAMNSYMLYKEKKEGVLSTFPFGAFAYARLDDRLKDEPLWKDAKREQGRDPMGLTKSQPNIEFFTTEASFLALYGGPKQYDDLPIDKKHAFAMITELFSPRSKGTVTLKSTDPLDNPIIDCNYLSDPLDVLVLTEGCRLGNEIVMKGAGTKDVIKGSWPANLAHHTFTSREHWIPHVKQHATTCYHAAGTCKMGQSDDKTAVLDPKLQVRGVKGLRVADCSVMPTLNGGHTQMPAYAIGEKAADLIKETWVESRLANRMAKL